MATIIKRLPQKCPSCDAALSVKKLVCTTCETEVEGLFTLPVLATFTIEEQQFLLSFIKASGSLKQMASILNLSYPTVRNYLDDIIAKINLLDAKQ